MDEQKRIGIVQKAIDEADKVFGADHAYFGEEGVKEVYKQLEKMGYNPTDYIEQKEILKWTT